MRMKAAKIIFKRMHFAVELAELYTNYVNILDRALMLLQWYHSN